MDGKLNKYNSIVVAGARAVSNSALCRNPKCKLYLNRLGKGKDAVEIIVKGSSFFLCPACALQFSADVKAAAESVMSAHDVARALQFSADVKARGSASQNELIFR